jgi:hypothetical protein
MLLATADPAFVHEPGAAFLTGINPGLLEVAQDPRRAGGMQCPDGYGVSAAALPTDEVHRLREEITGLRAQIADRVAETANLRAGQEREATQRGRDPLVDEVSDPSGRIFDHDDLCKKSGGSEEPPLVARLA